MPVITAKIDVTKISKDRLYKGAKGTYLDIVLIETPNSEYGDYMVVQGTTKEEREKGVKGAILGNAKVMGQGQGARRQERKPAAPVPVTGEPDDVPF